MRYPKEVIDMKIKITQSVALTKDQMVEVGQEVMSEDGWVNDVVERDNAKTNVYDCMRRGKYGNYHYRVNLSFKLITLKKVE